MAATLFIAFSRSSITSRRSMELCQESYAGGELCKEKKLSSYVKISSP
jgi:hypothetical protein